MDKGCHDFVVGSTSLCDGDVDFLGRYNRIFTTGSSVCIPATDSRVCRSAVERSFCVVGGGGGSRVCVLPVGGGDWVATAGSAIFADASSGSVSIIVIGNSAAVAGGTEEG